jgi:hypothetical protein
LNRLEYFSGTIRGNHNTLEVKNVRIHFGSSWSEIYGTNIIVSGFLEMSGTLLYFNDMTNMTTTSTSQFVVSAGQTIRIYNRDSSSCNLNFEGKMRIEGTLTIGIKTTISQSLVVAEAGRLDLNAGASIIGGSLCVTRSSSLYFDSTQTYTISGGTSITMVGLLYTNSLVTLEDVLVTHPMNAVTVQGRNAHFNITEHAIGLKEIDTITILSSGRLTVNENRMDTTFECRRMVTDGYITINRNTTFHDVTLHSSYVYLNENYTYIIVMALRQQGYRDARFIGTPSGTSTLLINGTISGPSSSHMHFENVDVYVSSYIQGERYTFTIVPSSVLHIEPSCYVWVSGFHVAGSGELINRGFIRIVGQNYNYLYGVIDNHGTIEVDGTVQVHGALNNIGHIKLLSSSVYYAVQNQQTMHPGSKFQCVSGELIDISCNKPTLDTIYFILNIM